MCTPYCIILYHTIYSMVESMMLLHRGQDDFAVAAEVLVHDMHLYISSSRCVHIYIYIHREREREKYLQRLVNNRYIVF